jgi:hypothetical protein
MPRNFVLLVTLAAGLVAAGRSHAEESAPPHLAGYLNHADFSAAVQELGRSELVEVKSLGKSAGGRDVWLVTIAQGKPETKPAIAIVGSLPGRHLAGSEIALRIARQIVQKGENDEGVKQLLTAVTLYIIPRPDPDASEKCFAKPYRVPVGNDRKTDDDRDFEFGEDPPNDLNGDGFITQMRIEDPAGTLIPHPDDPRVLIEADPKKNERGKYRLLTEGIDDDGDEEWNEDAGDGVAFDHNFTFGYRPFTANTGPNAVSENESRVIADFLFDRTNIAVVYTFSLDDNLFHPWKPNPQTERERIRRNILSSDAAAHGAFSRWAYFHYGRWSLNARPWWVPKTEAKKEEAKDGENKEEKTEEKKPSGEKRGADQINLLRWLDAKQIDGFVDWKEIEHPDFPGKKVEVGGFKPLVDLNPPAAELDKLAEKQLAFLQKLPDYLPKLELREATAKSLGGGVFRVQAVAANTGYLPTMPEMGAVNGMQQLLQIAIDVPQDTVFLQGHRRMEVRPLPGVTGKREFTWLVRFPAQVPESIELRLWSPAVGEVKTQLEVKE